jgi:hypothetical protein
MRLFATGVVAWGLSAGIRRCRGWQRGPRFSCGTTSANLPPLYIVHRLDARCATQRTAHALRRTMATTRIAGGVRSLTADCASARERRRARLHHPAMAVDKNLDTTRGVNPFLDVFDESLPVVWIAGRQEDTATRKRHMRYAMSKFHLHLVDPLMCTDTQQALGHAKGETGQRRKRPSAKAYWGRVSQAAWHRVPRGPTAGVAFCGPIPSVAASCHVRRTAGAQRPRQNQPGSAMRMYAVTSATTAMPSRMRQSTSCL